MDINWHAVLFSICVVIISYFIGSIAPAVVARGQIKASNLEMHLICLSKQMKRGKNILLACVSQKGSYDEEQV